MKYIFSIIFFVSSLLPNDHLNNNLTLSAGLSNISSYLQDNKETVYTPLISLGFSRTDNINFTSEFGIEYNLKSNKFFRRSNYQKQKFIWLKIIFINFLPVFNM